MKLVGLISGGKDSIYNLLQCIAAGHEVVAVANIEPFNKEEMDSYMYQSVGHEAISLVAAALHLPIFRQTTMGSAICKDKTYTVSENDEVEDMFLLLSKVKKNIFIEGVAVGAIASDYQRTRVESVCERLGLKCFAYLWKRDQGELLEEMIYCGLDAIIVKVASIGLKPEFHLGAHIGEIKNSLFDLHKKYGVNVCGEGGEYETLTLDCPLFTKVINVVEYNNVILTNDPFAPVGVLSIRNAILLSKPVNKKDPVLSQLTRLNNIQSNIKNPYHYIQDCLVDVNDSLVVNEEMKSLSEKFLALEPESLQSFALSQRMLHSSRSKISHKTLASSMESLSFDAISNLNYSTGWFFIGNATGPNLSQAFASVQKHLSRTDFDFTDIVLVELFVRDLSDFASMNHAYSHFVSKVLPPVRVCVETCLPPDVGILANVIAQKCVSKSRKALASCLSPEREVMHIQSISHWAPANIGPYSQCIRVGPVYYVAGQIPLVPGSMEILNESILSQCKLALRHVLRILEGMTSTLTFANVLQAICYVTSEQTASLVLPMWSFVTENKDAAVASVVVTNLPKRAELEWQVIACAADKPEVSEDTEKVENFKVYMKRCVFRESLVSSLVCKVSQARKRQKQKSETNLKMEACETLISIVKNSVNFLIAKMQCPGVPLCMLKLFYTCDEALIMNVINDITKSTENCKVTASGIPVVGCEEPDVFLTVTGVCH